MKKLEKLLQYLTNHNSFYQDRIKKYNIQNPLNIEEWPILTRQELQENRYEMFSEGYKYLYFNQNLIRRSSSGSSGIPINVYWSKSDYYRSTLSLWRKRESLYGVKPSYRYVVFTLNGINIIKKSEKLLYLIDPSNVLQINISLINTQEGYEQIIDLLDDFKPDWLFIQPFVLNQLVLIYQKKGVTPPKTIKYIESVGELLSADLRRRAETMFGVMIANMYGAEEFNGIALETGSHKLEILQDNVYVEIANEQSVTTNGEGRAVITNLNNYAMPLIRYDLADRIIKDNNVIHVVEGRNNECFNQFDFSPFLVSEIISETNNILKDCILNYRIEVGQIERTPAIDFYVSLEAGTDLRIVYQCVSRLVERKTCGRAIVGKFVECNVVDRNKKQVKRNE